MHELEDELPIPLGRAAAARPPVAEPVGPAAPAPSSTPPPATRPAAPVPPAPVALRPAAHIERTGPASDEPTPPAAAVAASTPPPPARPPLPPPVAVVEQPVARPTAADSASAASRQLNAPGDHPMAGLRGFRMEVELVKPARGGCARDLGCFVAAHVVVVAFVLALIAAFNALSTHAGSAHP